MPPPSSSQPAAPSQVGRKDGHILETQPIWPCTGRGLPSPDGRPSGWWALTPPFHPYPSVRRGGLFSVALSLGSPPVAVSDLPALWCPDFPPPLSKRRPPGLLRRIFISAGPLSRPLRLRRLGLFCLRAASVKTRGYFFLVSMASFASASAAELSSL